MQGVSIVLGLFEAEEDSSMENSLKKAAQNVDAIDYKTTSTSTQAIDAAGEYSKLLN